MDLRQRKLNKIEWDSIEIPVSVEEKTILKLIQNGFHSVNIRMNNTNSLFAFLKIEYSEKMEDYLYNKYFRNECDIIETTPTFLTSNDDIFNLAHYINDVMDVWTMIMISGKDPKQSNLLNFGGTILSS